MKKLLIFCVAVGFVFALGNTVEAAKWNVPGDFPTIQGAVDAAVDGDVIRVAAGVYETQVSIVGKDILLIGAVGATLKAPVNMEVSINYSDKNNYAIIFVQDADVNIRGFKVNGAGRGNTNYRFVGIFYYNAGGRIENCEVVDVRNAPLSGAQHGLGINVYNASDQMRDIFIINNNVSGFQKNGITVNGNWPWDYWSSKPSSPTYTNIKAHVNKNTITGAGAVSVIAQNCIQFGRGASGEIKNNTIKNASYTGDGWAATGILGYYNYKVFIQGNHLVDCDRAVYLCATPGSKVINNAFIIETFQGQTPWGVLVSGTDNKIMNNYFEDYYVGVYVGSSYYGDTYNTKVVTNRFKNVDYPVNESTSGAVEGTKERATKEYD